ncbi:hypothetical protein NHF41_20275 [Pseudomonas proteolytica]|nr:hypothetical protein [Pseudomonas proteolytica]USW98788.1 hypothetical protein NHF41_20275 [Pseudomonas proteolytica]
MYFAQLPIHLVLGAPAFGIGTLQDFMLVGEALAYQAGRDSSALLNEAILVGVAVVSQRGIFCFISA